MAAALGPFILEAHATMGQQHVARHRHGAPTDQPHIREGMVGRATRAGRDQRCPVAGESGNTLDAGGLYGFGGIAGSRGVIEDLVMIGADQAVSPALR